MNIPGFNAELSLRRTKGIYREKAGFGGSGMGGVSMQQFGSLFFTMRCCGLSTWQHHIVCVERRVSRFDNCRCVRSPDGTPFIYCRPLDIPVVDITQPV